MALQVWLPLNKNEKIENRGLSDITISGNPTYVSSGKLGGCFQFNSKMISIPTSSYMEMKSGNSFSVAFWVKGVSTGWLFACNAWEFRFREDYIQVHPGPSGATPAKYTTTTTSTQWRHCAFTWNNDTLILYVDGVLRATSTFSSNFNIDSTLWLCFDGTRYLNDFRVYNHCLSPKEVKEISKGLVLHYPMDNCNIEANNLLNNASSYREGTPYKCTTTSTDGYFYTNMYYSNDSLGGQTVTFSVSTNKQIAPSHGGSSSTHDKVGLWLYLKKTAYSWADGSYDAAINLNSSNNNFKSLGNNRYSWTYAIPSGYKGVMIRTNLYSNNGSSVTAYFWDFQLEFGSKASPFSPNKWTSATVYDCSGFGNNGSTTSTNYPIIDSDSPRYNSSFKFNGSQYINAGKGGKVSDSFSICWWGYMDNWSSYGRAASCTESGGWNFESTGTYMGFNVNINGSYYGTADTTALSSLTGWHHWVGTYDNNVLKIYRDGVLKSSNTTGTNKPITYNTTNSIWLGVEASSGENYEPSIWFKGKMSDFRIYATPLSAEDVKELYNTSAIVCDNGTVMAYSLEE